MTDEITVNLSEPPRDDATVADGTCLGCDYDLRGLRRDGTCPECGWSIEWSLDGAALRHADPAWLRRVGSGLGWLFVGNLLWLVMPIAVPILMMVFGRVGEYVAMTVVYMGLLIPDGCLLLGTWWATAAEPGGGQGGNADSRLRRLARWALIVGGAAWLVSYTLPAIGINFWPEFVVWSALVACYLSVLGYPLGLLALYSYLPRFAHREGHRRLAQGTRPMKWTLVVMHVVMWGWFVWRVSGANDPIPGLNSGWVPCFFLLALMGINIWELIVLGVYRMMFTRAA
jgi:hypothetical protein